jgi:hypothetical protein
MTEETKSNTAMHFGPSYHHIMKTVETASVLSFCWNSAYLNGLYLSLVEKDRGRVSMRCY